MIAAPTGDVPLRLLYPHLAMATISPFVAYGNEWRRLKDT